MFSETGLFPVLCFQQVNLPTVCLVQVCSTWNTVNSEFLTLLMPLLSQQATWLNWYEWKNTSRVRLSSAELESRKLFWAFITFQSAVLICAFLILILICMDFIDRKKDQSFLVSTVSHIRTNLVCTFCLNADFANNLWHLKKIPLVIVFFYLCRINFYIVKPITDLNLEYNI